MGAVAVIYVSSDRCQEDFDEYFKGMPWYALPYQERELKHKINTYFSVQGLPQLTVIDGQGRVLTHDGRRKHLDYFSAEGPALRSIRSCSTLAFSNSTTAFSKSVDNLGSNFVEENGQGA